MVDGMLPELELSPWEGHLGEVEVASSFSGPMPTADPKRPRIIAAAAGPPLPDGSNRRKRLFIVEPLGMWVKNGQAVPAGAPSSSASASPDVAAEHVPEHLRLSASPLDAGTSMLNNGANDMELRRCSYSTGDGQPAGGGALPTALAQPQGGEQQYQQQYQQQQYHQQQQYQQHQHQQLEPTPEDSGYQGPMRRLAASSGFPQAPVASPRFQPYTCRTPSSSPGSAAMATRMRSGSGGGGLPLLPLLNPAGVSGGGGPPDDVISTLLQLQGSGWMREAGLCPQQLLQRPWQPSREGPSTAANARAPAANAATSLWHTWMRGEEVPLDLAGGTTGGGGGNAGGNVPLYDVASSMRPLGQFAAAPAAAAAGTAHILQQRLLHLQHLQQQQPAAAAAASQRPPQGSGAWSDGCAEVWAAAFGEAAPGELPLHRVEMGIAAGSREAGGAGVPMRALSQEPRLRSPLRLTRAER